MTTFARIINDNLNYCGYAEAIKDIEVFCGLGGCSPKLIMKNMSGNIFKLIGDIQAIGEALRQFPVSEKEDAYLACYLIGTEAGKFIRTIFMFVYF